MNRLVLTVVAAIVLLALTFVLFRLARPNPRLSGPSPSVGMGMALYPESIAELVEHSSAIVVARFVEATDEGTVVLATANPVSGEPGDEEPVVHVEYVVDEVLKSDGNVEVNEHVYDRSYATLGPVPWPEDTEFILFLRPLEGRTEYYLPFGPCGSLFTDGETVTCSDGDHTVLGYMTGLSREDFIEAVVEEVENPSETATPRPSWTPAPTSTPAPTWTPSRTPTPCAGPGC